MNAKNIVMVTVVSVVAIMLITGILIPVIGNTDKVEDRTAENKSVSFTELTYERTYERWKAMNDEYGRENYDKYVTDAFLIDYDNNKMYLPILVGSSGVNVEVLDLDPTSVWKKDGSSVKVTAKQNGSSVTLWSLPGTSIYERKDSAANQWIYAPTYQVSDPALDLMCIRIPQKLLATSYEHEIDPIIDVVLDAASGTPVGIDTYKAPEFMNSPIFETKLLYQNVAEIPDTLTYQYQASALPDGVDTIVKIVPLIMVVGLFMVVAGLIVNGGGRR